MGITIKVYCEFEEERDAFVRFMYELCGPCEEGDMEPTWEREGDDDQNWIVEWDWGDGCEGCVVDMMKTLERYNAIHNKRN